MAPNITPPTATDLSQLCGPSTAGTETETLIGSLERQRRIFSWKAAGLDIQSLGATVGATTMTLGGLLKHLATETIQFMYRLHGRDTGAPVNAVDWDADPDWAWHSASADSLEELYRLYDCSVVKARAALAEALGPNDPGAAIWERHGQEPALSIRRLLVDVIEEYARHAGRADLIRESLDGLVGEDPPAT